MSLVSIISLFLFLNFNIDYIRLNYEKAVDDKSTTIELIKIAENQNNATALAYKASLKAIMAKHSSNVLTKLDYVKNAEKIFENAIKQEPNNLEARLLRILTESQTPSFLGYSKHINDDKSVIIKLISTSKISNVYLKKYLKTMLLKVELTENEKSKINTSIN